VEFFFSQLHKPPVSCCIGKILTKSITFLKSHRKNEDAGVKAREQKGTDMKNLVQKTAAFLMATLVSGIAMAVTITETHTNVSCNGGANGTINLTVTGGSAPYTFSWNGGNTNQNRTGLIAGVHSVTVTDNVGTTATASVLLTQPSAITVTKAITHVTCGGNSNGAIDITVLGGTPGYTYLWSNAATTQDLTNITAALYHVTITDMNGCIKVDSANVTQPAGVTITSVITNVTCGSGVNGAINITPSNGILPYTFMWNDGATTEDRSGIAAGTYSVTVNDALTCVGTATFVVNQSGSGMAVNTNSTQPSCNGGTNGVVNVTSVIGSVGPYSFNWSNGVTTQNNPNVGAGVYTVTATSTTGCTASASVNLGQPAVLNTTLNVVAISCFGMSNGAINTVTTGGTSPYSYNWGGGVFTQNRTGLATGTYSVTVTDFRGCTVSQSVTLGEPLQLSLTTVPSPLACTGGPTGSVMTNVTGGTGAISYWWGAGVTTPNKINVSSGTHSVTVTDANGCTASASAVIAPYTPMTTSATTTNALCLGSNTGGVNLTVNNGWTPYTFAWSNGASTEDLTNVAPGSYTVTVTDAHNCTVTRTATVAGPTLALTINATVNDATCFGLSNGSISLSGMNGASPYSFNWGSGITGSSRTNLSANTYNVTMTDNNGCSTSSALVLNQPPSMTWSNAVTNVSCFGQANGAISLTITGGISPYSYNWSNGANTQTVAGLTAGTYIITATDNVGCSASTTINVSQPNAPTFTTSFTDINCNGGTNGTISVSISGGNGPFSYLWNDGATSANRTGLAAGNYILTTSDNNSCTYQNNFTLNQPTAITITSTVTNVACNGGNTGTITTAVSGGNAPYSYNWGGGVTTPNRSNLTAGNYTLTLTDNNGCTATHTASISQSSTLSIIATVNFVTCAGGNNGNINLAVSGGSLPYSFNWGGGITTQNRTNLEAGTYAVTITDNAGCSFSDSYNVTQPSAIAATSTITNVACSGSNTGAINLSVSGGNAPYSFNWGGGVTTQNRTGLGAGNYAVTITDNSGCSINNTYTITQNATLAVSLTATAVSCFGGNNGSITSTVSGGNAPFSYDWGGGVTTPNRTGLTAGLYHVTITDNAGCSGTASTNVSEPTSGVTATTSTVNVSCHNGTNGAINLTPNGGTAPYSFIWGGGITAQNRTNLSAGNYNVTITDNNSCTFSTTATVVQPSAIALNITKTDLVCFNANNGAVSVNVTGGTSPFSYNWSNGAATPSLVSLAANTYSITATDANMCTASAVTIITQPTQLSTTLASTNVSCFGLTNGNITLGVNGGVGGYSFNWNNNSNTQNLNNIAAGNYTVTITDANTCSMTAATTISQPSQININGTVTDIACGGLDNGGIQTTVSGGNAGFTFLWSNSATSANLSNLTAGNYTLSATDANGCVASQTFTVAQTAALTVSNTKTDITCGGLSNGTITLTISGGTTPYIFLWNDGNTNQNRTNLSDATYTVTVTDANGCAATTAATITSPSQLFVSLTPTHVICNGAATGAVMLTRTGGNPGYSYSWNINSVNQNLTGMMAGFYQVTVTDASNCSVVASTTINEPAPISLAVNVTNVGCFSGSNGAIDVVVGGGNGGYVYNWSNGATTNNISNLYAGNYTISVTDALNCSVNLMLTVSQAQPVVLTETHTNASCAGASNGAIDVTVSGGMTGFTYNWSNGANTQDLNGLAAGTYTLTVFDGNNCSSTISATITEPAAIVLNASNTDVACHNGNTGAINLTVNGGVGPFTFNWSNAATTQNISNLTANIYTVTATDANSCSSSLSTSIAQASAIQIALTPTHVTCFGNNNGSISTAVSGGNASYSFSWSNATTTANLGNLAAGSYTLSVMDASNCVATATTVIQQPSAVQLSETHTNVSCFGGANAAINLTAAGGTGAFNFVWSNGATTEDLSQLTVGNYSVSATDANGCSSTTSVAITEPTALQTSATHKDFACNTNRGNIQLTTTGGTSPYTFAWSNGANTAAINNLDSGNYTATITDANGCSINQSVTINALPALSATTTVVPVTCFGGNNGSINVATTGGTAPYTFNWSNGAAQQNITNLVANTYTLTVADANACAFTATTAVTQPAALQLFSVINNTSCNGSSDGNIIINILGGTAPYSYTWSNGANTNSISNLAANTYSVTVQDANNCSNSSSNLVVSEPALLSVAANVLPVGCANINDGAIEAIPSGGTAPYFFNWSNGNNAANNSQLGMGNYDLTVTDSKGCTTSNNWSVGTTPPLTIAGTVSNTACPTAHTGAIALTIDGGTPNFAINWSNGDNTANISQLPQGTYQVEVTDSRSCTAQASFTISYDYILSVDAGDYANINLGETTTLTATTNVNHNNTYQWTPSIGLDCASCASTNTRPGFNSTFTVHVTDQNGCTAFDTVSVSVNSITDLYIPNAFTPNNDGNNDVFEIYGDINAIHFIEFNIFNRWGEKVFSTNDPTFKWDGTYKGQMADAGVYIYTMNLVFINGASRSDYKGSITMIR